MREDELQRRMDFIIEQQAEFAGDIVQLKNVQQQFQDQLGQLVNAQLDLVGIVQRVADAQLRSEQGIEALSARLSDTDERLNTLIARLDAEHGKSHDGFAVEFKQFAHELLEHEAAENQILRRAFGTLMNGDGDDDE